MTEYEDIRCGDASEGAAVGLLAMMTGISEDYWCAGWLDGNEYALWEAAHNGHRNYGTGGISERTALLLRTLSEECDGWWHWPDGAHNPRFITLDDWRAHLKARGNERTPAAEPAPVAEPAQSSDGEHPNTMEMDHV